MKPEELYDQSVLLRGISIETFLELNEKSKELKWRDYRRSEGILVHLPKGIPPDMIAGVAPLGEIEEQMILDAGLGQYL